MIREAVPDDTEAIVEIQHQSWLTTYVNEEYGISASDIEARFSNKPKRVSHIKAQFSDGKYKKWVAEVDGQVVGYCGAERLPGGNHLGGFYILEKYQSQGLGSQLIEAALEWLGNEKRIRLTVAPFNQKAISFYEKFGFRMGSRVPHTAPTFPTDVDMPEYEMIREPK